MHSINLKLRGFMAAKWSSSFEINVEHWQAPHRLKPKPGRREHQSYNKQVERNEVVN